MIKIVLKVMITFCKKNYIFTRILLIHNTSPFASGGGEVGTWPDCIAALILPQDWSKYTGGGKKGSMDFQQYMDFKHLGSTNLPIQLKPGLLVCI